MHLLLQLVHGLGHLIVVFLQILHGHRLLQALLQLLVQLLAHTRTQKLQPPAIGNSENAAVHVHETQDDVNFKRSLDDTLHEQQFKRDGRRPKGDTERRKSCFFCPREQWQKTLNGGAGLGGSVSMATSQLGNGCKSKHEGDIKGLNDKEGREKDIGSEDMEGKMGG